MTGEVNSIKAFKQVIKIGIKKKIILVLIMMLLFLSACSPAPDSYDSETAIRNGDVVNLHGQTYNVDKLDAFMADVKSGRKAKVQISEYTIEGDPILQILEYDGKVIRYTYDNSRDQFAGSDKGQKQSEMVDILKEENEDTVTWYLVDGQGNKQDIFSMKNAETAEVTALVEGFGEKLKSVYLTSPPEIVRQDIAENYGDYVQSELLLEWLNDPQKAPGRLTSSPWPERIEISLLEKLSKDIYRVHGQIIEVTSASTAEKPATILLKKSAAGPWLIAAVSIDNTPEPHKDIINDLRMHPELIPYDGVLGGTMGFYDPEGIRVLSNRWVFAGFDDGHINGYMLLSYHINDGKISWEVIDSYIDGE